MSFLFASKGAPTIRDVAKFEGAENIALLPHNGASGLWEIAGRVTIAQDLERRSPRCPHRVCYNKFGDLYLDKLNKHHLTRNLVHRLERLEYTVTLDQKAA